MPVFRLTKDAYAKVQGTPYLVNLLGKDAASGNARELQPDESVLMVFSSNVATMMLQRFEIATEYVREKLESDEITIVAQPEA